MNAESRRDLDALHEQLAETPGDDALRQVYADALEEAGDAGRAAAHRAIAGMRLGCFPRRPEGSYLSDEDRASRESDLRDYWDIFASGDYDDVYVLEGLHDEALVPFVTLGCVYGEDTVYVACTARADVLLSELLAQVGLAPAVPEDDGE